MYSLETSGRLRCPVNAFDFQPQYSREIQNRQCKLSIGRHVLNNLTFHLLATRLPSLPPVPFLPFRNI